MAYENGRLPSSQLAVVPGTGIRIRRALVPQTAALRAVFRARFGKPLKLTSGYRAYSGCYYCQLELFLRRYSRSYLVGRPMQYWNGVAYYLRAGQASAAVPGTSNHGWGEAIDFGSGVNTSLTSPEHRWMRMNAVHYGWVHPAWAHDPKRPWQREPWHFEAAATPVSYPKSSTGSGITVPTLPGPAPLTPEDDMPLTDAEMTEVARRVWTFRNPALEDRDAYALLRRGTAGVEAIQPRTEAIYARTWPYLDAKVSEVLATVRSIDGGHVDEAALARNVSASLVPAVVDAIAAQTGADLTTEQITTAAESAVRAVLGSLDE